ncbi:hypothetical protein GGR26_000149 [Lewinella marina]|uniref:Secretion system C-terminal sorting domain-containing protein n=1 Tax=Neolewinella marina TaxID=438751 RepID=A0A2G0CKE1_9BACT|nr:hypothetical protein [Neolewinella marina]NJB84404.1 hypothetical protein [Neolewinella marina]PHL00401.1 hypothetical protein CGL56_05040 [Neolewinella marina]
MSSLSLPAGVGSALRLLFACLLAAHLTAQPIYQGGIAGGDDSAIMSEAVLPAQLTEFRATVDQANRVLIHWRTEQEINVSHYTVEFSPDGTVFTEVAVEAARPGPNTDARQYAVSLPTPAGYEGYYRLRMVDADGSFDYSSVERVDLSEREWTFAPVANPVVNGQLELRFGDLPAATSLSLAVYSLDGRRHHRAELQPGTAGTYRLSASLPPAVYLVTVAGDDGVHRSERVVVGR